MLCPINLRKKIMTTTNIEMMKPLTQAVFKKFLADELTVKQVKVLEPEIAKRFHYIVHKIAELTGRSVDWYDYSNESGNDNYNSYDESTRGYFDTDNYKEHVGYTGDFPLQFSQIARYEKYDEMFPTKWFYTNFEVQLKNEKQEFLNEQQRLQEEKEKGKNFELEEMQKMRDSIMKKLTPEELAYITFVKIEDVRKNKSKVSQSVAAEVAQFIKEMKKKGVAVSQQYTKYREGKKKAKSFEAWVLKNMEKIRESAIPKTVLSPAAAWPFPTPRVEK